MKLTLVAAVLTAAGAAGAAFGQMPHAAAACGWSVAQAGSAVDASDSRIVVTADTMALLRKLLEKRQFAELEARLARYDSAVMTDVRNDDAWMAGYRAFYSNVPWLELELDDWVTASPQSPHARAARAWHHVARAIGSRGQRYGLVDQDTAPNRWYHWARLVRSDLAALPETSTAAIQGHIAYGALRRGDSTGLAALDSALARLPASFVIRQQYVLSLRTRWGGSRELIERFARESQSYAGQEPRLRALLGFADWDEAGDRLDYQQDTLGSDSLLAKALTYGDAADFRQDRAQRLLNASRWQAAIADYECAVAIAPWRMDAVAMRAWTLARLGAEYRGRPESRAMQLRAYSDLRTVSQVNYWDATVLSAARGITYWVGQDVIAEYRGFWMSHWDALTALLRYMKELGLFLFISLANVLAWRRYRFYLPRYVHVLAALTLATMLAIDYRWYIAWGTWTPMRTFMTVGYPLFVYFVFITYGGAKAAFEARRKTGSF